MRARTPSRLPAGVAGGASSRSPRTTAIRSIAGLCAIVCTLLATSVLPAGTASAGSADNERFGPEADVGPPGVVSADDAPDAPLPAGPDPSLVGFDEPRFVQAVDNGAWSWYQDERIMVDGCRVLIGSVADGSGAGGEARSGDIQVSEIDRSSGAVGVHVLERALVGDDHNAPALLRTDDGVLAAYAGHNEDRLVRFGLQVPDGIGWERTAAVEFPSKTSYANLFRASDGTVLDFTRSNPTSDPVAIAGNGNGRTWATVGPLFTTVGNEWPYVKYATDGDDIHVLVTPSHPNQTAGSLSILHGIIRDGSVLFSDGTPVGEFGDPLSPTALTLIQAPTGGSRAWPVDLQVIDGVPVALYTVHQTLDDQPVATDLVQARYLDGAWQSRVVADAGSSLYPGQPFYTGGGALDPTDADRIFLSTDVNPVTGAPLVSGSDSSVHHELFRATSADGGSSWTFSPVTADSTVDNLRPIMAVPDESGGALAWFRGAYTTYRSYHTEIVAIVESGGAGCPLDTQVDATPVPAAGDFDGDTGDDLLFTVPGPALDFVSLAGQGGRRNTLPVTANGDYQRAVGDFDGDGADDVFWYAPGPTNDHAWFGGPGAAFTTRPFTVEGSSYRPFAGDFGSDGYDDIFWYAPGPDRDFIWYGGPTGFTSVETVVNGASYRPFTGDFDGDGRSDILWYGPGETRDHLWRAGPSSSFTSTPTTIRGTYEPHTGDFDGDGNDDVFFHGPGSRPDHVWYLDGGVIDARPAPAISSVAAVAVDLDRDGRDDLLAVTPGPTPDRVLLGLADRTFAPADGLDRSGP